MKKLLTIIFLLMFGSGVFCSEYKLEAIRLYNLGLEKNRVGAYMSAIDYFKEAIDIQPDFYDAYYNLAVLYDYLGKTPEAVMYLETILKNNPYDSAALYKLASIYHKKGEFTKAKELLESIPPTSAEYNKARDFLSRINLENSVKAANLSEIAAKTVPVAKKLSGINSPSGIASDSNGNIYVASFSDNAVFKLMPNGIHQLYSKSSKINGPVGIAFDKNDNLYVANYNANNIVKISKYGDVSVFVKYLEKPYCLYVKNNVLYAGEQGNSSILMHKLN